MPEPPMEVPKEVIKVVNNLIQSTEENGKEIRKQLGNFSNEETYNVSWEVAAAVEALSIVSSRWTIEIMAAIYIAGPQRFNQLKKLLQGISSRTLSDKLRMLVDEGYLERQVIDGPPLRTIYAATEHGMKVGRMFSSLVAYLKIELGMVKGKQ
tara:strand:+ start:215 stop:673 length:459 start_codon:yes stop_codon:yes gene_type:complete